eukprot:6172466-Pleurochrysis_carterae.AAC.2
MLFLSPLSQSRRSFQHEAGKHGHRFSNMCTLLRSVWIGYEHMHVHPFDRRWRCADAGIAAFLFWTDAAS